LRTGLAAYNGEYRQELDCKGKYSPPVTQITVQVFPAISQVGSLFFILFNSFYSGLLNFFTAVLRHKISPGFVTFFCLHFIYSGKFQIFFIFIIATAGKGDSAIAKLSLRVGFVSAGRFDRQTSVTAHRQ